MSLALPTALLKEIQAHGAQAYPEEGAGLLLGAFQGNDRRVSRLLPLDNRFRPESRDRRYLLDPRDLLAAEDEAERRGLEVVGVFHSHPDHPALASEFDTQWALPVYSYLITQIQGGVAIESRSWRLAEDRGRMTEEPLQLTEPTDAEEAR
jgi:proteasome lid subunit RPN8/RPN11